MRTPQQTDVRSGYLVLADISGYTAFLAGTELEHAHGILSELTAHIRAALAPPLRFVKLEGDCVFCYAPDDAFGSAERLIELIEVCYLEFSDRLLDMQRATTCTCAACASIHTLDLKFIAHFGSFAISRDGNAEDLTGKDVILAHRLLKNTVAEETGVQAYALFTEAFLTADVAAPPALVWDAWMDPRKIISWQHDLTGMEVQPNERGRTGVGSTSHCAHGSALSAHRYLDFRPFRYWTEASDPIKGFMGPPAATYTVELTPTEDGTHVVFRMRARARGLRSAVMNAAFGPMVRRSLSRYARQLKEMGEAHARHVAED